MTTRELSVVLLAGASLIGTALVAGVVIGRLTAGQNSAPTPDLSTSKINVSESEPIRRSHRTEQEELSEAFSESSPDDLGPFETRLDEPNGRSHWLSLSNVEKAKLCSAAAYIRHPSSIPSHRRELAVIYYNYANDRFLRIERESSLNYVFAVAEGLANEESRQQQELSNLLDRGR